MTQTVRETYCNASLDCSMNQTDCSMNQTVLETECNAWLDCSMNQTVRETDCT